MTINAGSKRWWFVAGAALVALGLECGIGFGLAFSPGWANGWPGGLSVHDVWSAGLSLLLGVVVATLAVAIGAAVAALGSRRGLGGRLVLACFLAWLLLAMVLASPVCRAAFGELRASALEMWPAGYDPR